MSSSNGLVGAKFPFQLADASACLNYLSCSCVSQLHGQKLLVLRSRDPLSNYRRYFIKSDAGRTITIPPKFVRLWCIIFVLPSLCRELFGLSKWWHEIRRNTIMCDHFESIQSCVILSLFLFLTKTNIFQLFKFDLIIE